MLGIIIQRRDSAPSLMKSSKSLLTIQVWSECVSRHMPSTQDDFKKKNVGYGRVLAVSLLLGSNDGCHIPIKCPPGGLEACKEYHDFKNFNSILLMGLVDSHYRFVWGSCNFPGFIWVFSLICAAKMIHYRSLLAETSLTNALDKRYCSYSLCPYSNIWIFSPLCWTWSNDVKSRFFVFSE